ncbi:MAG: M1 family metallopeptidase, partial [Chloroflexi bacterium]|nr:M1 family metallopeptidase [Chloroflexota bacterium]
LAFSRRYQTSSQEDASGTVLHSHYYPAHQTMGEAVLAYASRSFRLFSELFGPYPYGELDLAEVGIDALGIEYPGFIVLAESLYANEDPSTEFVVVHEMAHQWWYGLVGNDQLDEPWLDEALANYSTALYFEKVYGAEAGARVVNGYRQRYEGLLKQGRDAPVAQPVTAFREEDYGSVVYQKGALFFHALRQEVGDDRFLAILRQYQARYRYGIARGKEFLSLAEALSGRSLRPLAQEWLYSAKARP